VGLPNGRPQQRRPRRPASRTPRAGARLPRTALGRGPSRAPSQHAACLSKPTATRVGGWRRASASPGPGTGPSAPRPRSGRGAVPSRRDPKQSAGQQEFHRVSSTVPVSSSAPPLLGCSSTPLSRLFSYADIRTNRAPPPVRIFALWTLPASTISGFPSQTPRVVAGAVLARSRLVPRIKDEVQWMFGIADASKTSSRNRRRVPAVPRPRNSMWRPERCFSLAIGSRLYSEHV
jgi:hypothetical protein